MGDDDASAAKGGTAMQSDADFVRMDPKEIQVREPFSKIFRIREAMRRTIAGSMRESGYDANHPISVWRQENIVVDGHTRRQAAIDAGVEVMVCFHDFKDEDEALDYAIDNQRNRRNLSSEEIAAAVIAVDKRRKKGGDWTSPAAKAIAGKPAIAPNCTHSSKETAKKVGVSRHTVDQVRAVSATDKSGKPKHPEEKEAMLEGTMTIAQAAKAVKAKKPRKRRKHIDAAETSARDRAAFESVPMGNGTPRARTPEPIPEMKNEDRVKWLESFELRKQLANPKGFDADALIVHEYNWMLIEMRDGIKKLIGERSRVGMSSIHRVLARVFHLPDPKTWYLCENCNGTGIRNGTETCGACRGCGYIIPNFTKEKP